MKHIKSIKEAYSDLLKALEHIDNGRAVPCQYAINRAKRKLGDILNEHYK